MQSHIQALMFNSIRRNRTIVPRRSGWIILRETASGCYWRIVAQANGRLVNCGSGYGVSRVAAFKIAQRVMEG